jgi:hypothetical protein
LESHLQACDAEDCAPCADERTLEQVCGPVGPFDVFPTDDFVHELGGFRARCITYADAERHCDLVYER